LGARASSDSIQQGSTRAQISATFSLSTLPHIKQWLVENDLDNIDDPDAADECLIRRTVDVKGKSRATVNDTPVSIQTLKNLGQQLVSIHGQHAHQTLVKASDQRSLLDNFSSTKQLIKVQDAYQAWQESQQLLDSRQNDERTRTERLDLISFQLREFDELDIGPLSVKDIESEHQWRANSERIGANRR